MTEVEIPVDFKVVAVEDKVRFHLDRLNLNDYRDYTLKEALDIKDKLNIAITNAAAAAYFKSGIR